MTAHYLTTTTLDLSTGALTCAVSLVVQGNVTPISAVLQEEDLLAQAAEDGRQEWNNADVIDLVTEAFGFEIAAGAGTPSVSVGAGDPPADDSDNDDPPV